MTDENIIEISQDEIEESAKRNNITPILPVKMEDYPTFTIDQMDACPPKPQELVLSPILPTQGIAWVYASTGLGKTLFTLNMAYAIALGGSFLKYDAPKPLKVLYVDGEMSYDQMYQRIKIIQKHQGDLDFPENLHFINPDKLLPRRILKIDTPQGQFFYKKKLLDEGFDVVVFDNLSMLSSIDTNKTAEWLPVQDFLLDLRANGITVVMVHHSGKDKNGYRGTSMLMDCADVAVSLQPVMDDGVDEEVVHVKKFNLVYTKNRNFYGKHALPYEVQFLDGRWSYESLNNTRLDQVVEMVNMKMNYSDIAKELGVHRSTIGRIVQKAQAVGRLPR